MDVPRPPAGDTVAALRKKKAKRRLIALIVIGLAIIGVYWYLQKTLSLPLQKIVSFENILQISTSSPATQNFSAPGPLQQVTKALPKKTNALTGAGIVTNTNIQRAQNGNLPPLAENTTLDAIAALRINDLFQQQYFAHVNSSTGESAETVASSVGYAHLSLGENLALGNYAGDAGVVEAWMQSPGHRANILNPHYTQIGVAVRMGMFQGQNSWIAVQVFGRPASDCPAPDPSMKANIDLSETQIATMSAQLDADKAAIAAMSSQSGPEYNQKVEEYNALVAQYNDLTTKTKIAIDEYNAAVQSFDACLAE